MTCSQLSSTIRISFSCRNAIRLGYRVVGANPDAKKRSKRARHEQRIGQRREIDESDAVGKVSEEAVGHCHRHRGFSDASRTDDRDEAVS